MTLILHKRAISCLCRLQAAVNKKRQFDFNTFSIKSKFNFAYTCKKSFISFFRQCLAGVQIVNGQSVKLSLAFSFLVKEIDDDDDETKLTANTTDSDVGNNKPPDVVAALTALLKSGSKRIHYIVPGKFSFGEK